MLVLSRQVHEAIVVGEFVIEVLQIRGDKVRLSIQSGGGHVIVSSVKNNPINLADDITIMIVEIRKINGKNKVRLGIDAPLEIGVHRKEVWDALNRNPRIDFSED